MKNATQRRPACSSKQVLVDADKFEDRIGIRYAESVENHVGYLANLKPTTHTDQNDNEVAAVVLYFIKEDGSWLKGIKVFEPYFYIRCDEEVTSEIIFYLNKTYEQRLKSIDIVLKEDLELVNHLSGKKGKFIKLSFNNVMELMEVKAELMPIVKKNQAQRENQEIYDFDQREGHADSQFLSRIYEIREYDVAYHIRTMIDNEIRCSFWYQIKLEGALLTEIKQLPDKLDKADLRIFAFDIETTKAELKFPDSKFDQIMMISYIVDGNGFLITNRQVVAEDIQDFEYSPKPEYDVGVFKVFNEPDEKQLLVRFFEHIRETKPFIFTTFNGDFFDWPFIQDRAEMYKMKIEEEIGVYNATNGEMYGRFAPHLDCFYWVKRDAYLPQGSHGLKAVTKAKLGYDPVELDPELMLPYAQERPQELAEYSVSDSVATYFLYKKMIHDFIFALCTIIPTYPDEVLRRGSGTLCENLLMAQAFRGNIIFPNKQVEKFDRFHNGKLIDSDTYTGGTVECLQQGVYRSDIPVKFRLVKEGYQRLINETEDIIKFAVEIESNAKMEDVENYEEVKEQIIGQLTQLKGQCPFIESEPLIYHVDVAAMYPNIILSNRLQPVAIVNEQTCAGCIYNKEENRCKRNLDWQWKGEMFPLSRAEFEQVKGQLEHELENMTHGQLSNMRTTGKPGVSETQSFNDKLKQRVKQYCQKVYKQVHVKKQELKTDTVCMRENPFYVDTVRDFRDRRYEFKRLVKVWVAKFKEAQKSGNQEDIEIAKNRMSLFESLQLAHKIILNSFYGYVMKKGARWYSMEMAAMVTHTGGCIITDSRQLFDQIGMPLELDTDGIWTLLPKGFPESYSLNLKNGKKVNFDFPCTMCNNLIYWKYGNDQYQTLKSTGHDYDIRNEMSIFFEIDGPYRCMLIPSSKEENKMLKKRYAVFNHAGKMTEVKGFELKRRGELKIIKIFQEEVFSKFLEGTTLQECYDACGEVGERWYDILDSKGEYIDEVELIEYIGEERVIQKSLSEYGKQKGTALTAARRLAEFLGDEILREGGGLNVKFIISKLPSGAKVADRAVPTSIFQEKQEIKIKYLKKWLRDSSADNFDIRSILDWDYYKERLGGSIQKIITIPAFLQKCMNPIPKIEYPPWLHKRKRVEDDKFKQKRINSFFNTTKDRVVDVEDLEKMGVLNANKSQKFTIAKEKKDNEKKIQEKYSNISECPDPSNDANFKEWMKYQKQNWRKIRESFKNKKDVVVQKSQQNLGLENQFMNKFIKNMDNVILNSVWHIVQIEQTPSPGVMRLWIFNNESAMFDVKVRVPRTVYINSYVNQQGFKQIKNKALPRNRQIHNLYEWQTSEENFQDNIHDFTHKFMLNNDVEGVYETKMPLQFRALFELGCLVKPKKNMIPVGDSAKGRIYSINELEVKNNMLSEQPYLRSGSFKKIMLLHRTTGVRHVLTLYLEDTKQCFVFTVDPSRRKFEENADILVFKNTFKQVITEAELEIEMADWDIPVQYGFNELPAALRHIDKLIKDKHKDQIKQATLCILQSDLTAERLQYMGLMTLMSDFPVVCYPIESVDRVYSPLTWMQDFFRSIVDCLINGDQWLQDRVHQSRYAVTPLGNIQKDSYVALIDILFARSLNMNGHIIWYSKSNMPDLGGHEDQDFRSYFQEEIENPEWIYQGFYRGGYSIEIDIKVLAINTILQADFLKEFEDATRTAKINKANDSKSKYDKGFANKREMIDLFDTDLDEFVTCSAAFKVLKQLASHWVADLANDDVQADNLLSNVYRWLTSSKLSNLYDPLLHRLIHKLMTMNMKFLLSRFKQLQCKIIYANFHKIIVQVEQRTLHEAETHLQFAIEKIQSGELFRFVRLEPVEYWGILLFKDRFNYVGINETTPDDVTMQFDVMHHLPPATWKKFEGIVKGFVAKVYKHNIKLKSKIEMDELLGANMNGNQLVQSSNHAKIENVLDAVVDDRRKEPDHEFVAELITSHYAQQLFQIVSDVIENKSLELDDEEGQAARYAEEADGYRSDYGEELDGDDVIYRDQYEDYLEEENDYEFEADGKRNKNKGKKRQKRDIHVEARKRREREKILREQMRWKFPVRIGSYHDYSSPALEFSKFISTHIFGLDEAFYVEAQKIRSNLLRMVKCKEFSQEAQTGLEPSLVLVVPDVICDVCCKCFDLDICRDPSIQSTKESMNLADIDGADLSEQSWRCSDPDCSQPLNKFDIERRLIDLVNRRLVQYQIQDLVCQQCRMVKNTIVPRYCECTGGYLQTIGNIQPDKLKNQNLLNNLVDIQLFMQLLRNFATHHSMSILRDTTQQIMQVL